jgi:uncharacterized protein (TIGR03546 family)
MLLLKKIRKLIALLRGQVSPVLVGIAAGLGFWFGLIPGFTGVSAVILMVIVLLNVPVGLFLLFAGLGKTFCFAAAPILYYFGVFVQQHLAWLLQLLSKIPILGLTDFNRPAIAGSVVGGPVDGLILGFIAGYLVLSFRKTWLKLENNSEKFTKWQSKGFIKVLDRILIGKRAANAKGALEAKTIYLRKAGAILVMLVLVACATGVIFVKDSLILDKASQALTKTNGATVVIEEVDLSPASGKVSIAGIAMTDRENLSQNKIQIGRVSSQTSIYDLSVGRLVMDEVLVSDVKFNQKRDTPGKMLNNQQVDTPKDGDITIGQGDLNKLEKYFNNAREIKEMIDKVRRWIPKSQTSQTDAEPVKPQKYLDYLTASPTRDATVKMLARKIIADKVELDIKQFGLSKITLSNLSNAPDVARLPVGIDIDSQSGGANLNLTWHFESEDSPGNLSGTFKEFDMAMMQAAMSNSNAMQFQSGKASGTIEGLVTQDLVDIVLGVNIKDLKANSGGKGMFGLDVKTLAEVFKVMENLDLTLRIVGPVAEPQIIFDSDALTETFMAKLKEAGKARLAGELNKQLQKHLGNKVPEELKELIKPKSLTDSLKSLMGTYRADE